MYLCRMQTFTFPGQKLRGGSRRNLLDLDLVTLKAQFDAADTNKDGVVSFPELAGAVAAAAAAASATKGMCCGFSTFPTIRLCIHMYIYMHILYTSHHNKNIIVVKQQQHQQ